MTYLPHTINEKTITMIIGNRPESIAASHTNFAKIKAKLITGEHDDIPELLNVRKGIEAIGLGDITIEGDEVKYQGRVVPSYQAQKLISMYKQGHKNIEPYKMFVKNLMQNPSPRAIEEFARFADYKELPISEDGMIFAWRGLQEDYWSRTGNLKTRVIKGKVNEQGQIFNGVGEEIEVERQDVDDDFRRECSFGCHVGSGAYAKDWGRNGKVVMVKFNPKDVVSVPADCNSQKCRLTHYWVVADHTGAELTEKAVISDSGKNLAEIEDIGVDFEEYYYEFCDLVETYFVQPSEEDLIIQLMNDRGFVNETLINEIINDFKLADRIVKYINNKKARGETATIKGIQGALKINGLTQEKISYVVDKYSNLI